MRKWKPAKEEEPTEMIQVLIPLDEVVVWVKQCAYKHAYIGTVNPTTSGLCEFFYEGSI